MSGELKITVTVEGGGSINIEDALNRAWKRKVKKNPGACRRCVANEDPDRVPMHKHCECTVIIVEDNSK